MVKNLPMMLETWVWYLGWENPLEKGMATHSSILDRRIPWTDKQATGHEITVKHDWVINTFIFLDNEILFVTASEYKKVWLNIWLIDKETGLQEPEVWMIIFNIQNNASEMFLFKTTWGPSYVSQS